MIAHPLEAADGHHGYSSPRGDGADNLIVADTLSAGSHPGSNMPGRRREDDTNLVTAFHPTGGGAKGLSITDEQAPGVGTIRAVVGVKTGASVRRLTPVECERLQGLPDGWTDPHGDAPDSRRYAGLGDAVTSTVAEWIGRRIIEAA